MSVEQHIQKVYQDRRILTDASEKRLLGILNHTSTPILFDYIANLLLDYESQRGDDEYTDAYIDHLIERRKRVEEVICLKALYKIKPSEQVVLEEQVNEALFKQFGD